MTAPKVVGIRFVRGDTVFHVYPAETVQEGVYLAEGQVDGIYDAPVKTTWKTGAFQEGSRQKAYKKLHRDMTLGFHIRDTYTSYEFNESEFRRMFSYEPDQWAEDPDETFLEVETDLSGVRRLSVLMYEQPEFHAAQDPIKDQYGNLLLKLRAGDPDWAGDDVIDEFGDTTAASSGVVTVENPTDQTMYHKWVLTRGTWTLPDFQWVGEPGERVPGGAHADRTISNIVVSTANGGAVVDLDRQNLMFRDANDTNILAQLAGKVFAYPIPPYTPENALPVSYTAAPAGGAMARLVMPRRWSRPWGLEMPSMATWLERYVTTIQKTGAYTYHIPDFADAIDIILLGAGGGGGGPRNGDTDGGTAGSWTTTTLVRGVDIPWDTLTITGVIGAGGIGTSAHTSPTNGGATTATATGITPLSAAGGVGAAASSSTGQGAGTRTVNDRTYAGGGDAVISLGYFVRDGRIPGGGGAGSAGRGGNGARGQAWFYAYELGS